MSKYPLIDLINSLDDIELETRLTEAQSEPSPPNEEMPTYQLLRRSGVAQGMVITRSKRNLLALTPRDFLEECLANGTWPVGTCIQ